MRDPKEVLFAIIVLTFLGFVLGLAGGDPDEAVPKRYTMQPYHNPFRQ